MDYFENKITLLTGASGGLGSEFATQLLDLGAHMILSDLKIESLDRYKSYSGKGKVLGLIAGDVSTKEGTERFLADVKKVTSCPDILINNAGIAQVGPFGEIPLDRWEKLMNINLISPMRICHYFLPVMAERGSGHIVNISSVAGIVPMPGGAPYTASKHGIKGFSDAMRIDYAKKGILVSTVHPFFTKTAILQSERFGGVEVNADDYSFMIETPEKVIRETIKAIANKSEFILPGPTAKLLDLIRRFAPSLIGITKFF
ncbi:MAG TPA: SDR family NAD(P)-dependent oxidoreductase [Turneriella sp.]|nr:SDR family NAD(P)-dependent oxidoreductase [Turneriella sp.]